MPINTFCTTKIILGHCPVSKRYKDDHHNAMMTGVPYDEQFCNIVMDSRSSSETRHAHSKYACPWTCQSIRHTEGQRETLFYSHKIGTRT